MDANQIDDILTGYDRIAQACQDAIRDDHNLIDEQDRWLPRVWADDFTRLEYWDGHIRGAAQVWTVQTGGSNENLEFTIPLDTLNKYLGDQS